MSTTVLNAATGRTTGSPASRRLRREEQIPAVVYGLGMEPISVTIDRRELRRALSGPSGVNTILDLTVDGQVYPAIVKEMQRHPVRREVAHVDFLQVDLNVEFVVNIPVRLDGEAREVSRNNGLVDQQMTELAVRTTPRNIPNEIVVDISEMTVDTVIHVGDVNLPEGVTAAVDADYTVVGVTILRTGDVESADDDAEAGDSAENGDASASDDAGDAAE
ncbi:MAG: 50S ribosomal protein L25 [Actinomycetota bacterium]|nr:50S ribosomal protein L25 [Actinomycetota bacterium]MDA3007801.1 50S ribosomal protein L25 [Actinomycetota bacterium]MDA3035032.1 50S ribosomal protein L25 [Actinomycetota bacterium]